MYQRMARGRNPAAGGIAREENEGSRSTLGPSEYRGGMRIGQSEERRGEEIGQREEALVSLGPRHKRLRGERMTIVVPEVNAPFTRALRNDGDSRRA